MKFRPKAENIPSGNTGEFQPAKSGRLEITEEAQIHKIIENASKLFYNFLSARGNNKGNKKEIAFEIKFEPMLDYLNLARIPRERAIKEMDKIVMSMPGIIKTKTSYTVSSPELLQESLDAQATSNKILKIFKENPNIDYTTRQIADKLGIDINIIRPAIKNLSDNNEIDFVGTIPGLPGREARIYKFTSKVK